MRALIVLALLASILPGRAHAEDWPSTALTPRICKAAEKGTARPGKFNGSISFSAAEKALHRRELPKVIAATRACLERALAYRATFSAKPANRGLDPYYGAVYDRTGLIERLKALTGLTGRAELKALSERLIPTSCVGLAVKCLEEGFTSSGLDKIWTKIHKFRCRNGTTGIALQHALRQLGWRSVYWNHDVAVYGDDNWRRVERSKIYGSMRIPIDDMTTLTATSKGLPEAFRKVPLSVATAEDGFHVFLGINPTGIPAAFKAIEGSVSGAPGLAKGLEPGEHYALDDTTPGPIASGGYTSGIVLVPPGHGFGG